MGEFIRLMRESEGIFADDTHKLASQAKHLDTRVLRRVLEYFRMSKLYLSSLSKDQLIALFCDSFKISANDNIHDKLHIRTVGELYEAARSRDDAVAQRKEHHNTMRHRNSTTDL